MDARYHFLCLSKSSWGLQGAGFGSVGCSRAGFGGGQWIGERRQVALFHTYRTGKISQKWVTDISHILVFRILHAYRLWWVPIKPTLLSGGPVMYLGR